ncbi:MAG: DNA mismatch repair protein MutS, partial [Proteobacteria bacterium]|nr:DNA mismatch repair protein MutS [Pseudomonadota bacterium]
YEMFFDDAKKAAPILDITLTSREGGKGHRVPMCGIPYHAAQGYINRLTREGLKVAICEQVEDPKASKGIVKREVIRIITPGTNIEDDLSDFRNENFIAGLYEDKGVIGLAHLNLGTGDFRLTELRNQNDFGGEFARISPMECIIPAKMEDSSELYRFLNNEQKVILNPYEDWVFDFHHASGLLKEQFKIASLEGLGLEEYPVGVSAAGVIIHYLQDNLHHSLEHIKRPVPYSSKEYMMLDRKTQKNLEIVDAISGDKGAMTLFKVLNKTVSSLGSRLLRLWIKQPLIIPDHINARLEAVDEIVRDRTNISDLREVIESIKDFERILGRLGCGLGSARDLVALKESLQKIPELRKILTCFHSHLLLKQLEHLPELKGLVDFIERTIVNDPPLSTKDGGMIKTGYCKELDELHQIAGHGKEWLVQLQRKEVLRTGIKSLKVRYNKVFGYYIEVTKANLNQVPDYYIRRQTLVNAERFIIPELKEYEEKILGAEERSSQIESGIFEEIRSQVMVYTREIQTVAEAVATLDVLANFAFLSLNYGYLRPIIDDGSEIRITDGRHPVVERVLDEGMFVENDVYLNQVDHQLLIITGPNMAGKSTYLRQCALIVLMAQIGSFVPAASARIGVVDRIFTRIGASDNLAQGESTFMVEMIETAHILNNATERSLLILDEIGRGTSTFDGVSIAWAVCEHLGKSSGLQPKTLFATHYHELTSLEQLIPGVKNYNVMVKEYDDEVVFMRKIFPGGADRSYGIHVGKLAGLPDKVVLRAQEILSDLENGPEAKDSRMVLHPVIPLSEKRDLKIYQEQPVVSEAVKEHPLIKEIKEIDIENMTPLETLNRLHQLKEKAKSYRSEDQPILIHKHRKKG